MRFIYDCALAEAILAGAACVTLADQLKSDYDQGVDFFKYRTYSLGTVTTANAFYVERIKQAVDESLRAKGWRKVPSSGELTIFAHDRVHNKQKLETTYGGV